MPGDPGSPFFWANPGGEYLSTYNSESAIATDSYQRTTSQAAEKFDVATVSYQGTASAVPLSPLFLSSRADFSPRGICFSDFFSSLFSRAIKA
jgi:hypothetical protein